MCVVLYSYIMGIGYYGEIIIFLGMILFIVFKERDRWKLFFEIEEYILESNIKK